MKKIKEEECQEKLRVLFSFNTDNNTCEGLHTLSFDNELMLHIILVEHQ